MTTTTTAAATTTTTTQCSPYTTNNIFFLKKTGGTPALLPGEYAQGVRNVADNAHRVSGQRDGRSAADDPGAAQRRRH